VLVGFFDFIIAWRETRTRPNAYFCYMDNRMLITVGKSFDYCQQAC